MEQRNLFAAIFLTILVYVVWFYVYPPKKQPVEPAVKQSSVETVDTTRSTGAPAGTFDSGTELSAIQPSEEEKVIQVETPLYKAEFSSRGAVIKQLHLKKYRENNGKDSGLKYLIDRNVVNGTYALTFDNPSLKGLDTANFTPESESEVQVNDKKQQIRFAWKSDQGLIVEKIFEFSPDSYQIAMKVLIKNGSGDIFKDNATVSLQNKIIDKSNIAFVGPSLYMKKELIEVSPGSIEKENQFKGSIHWLAIQDRYFIMSLIPKDTLESNVHLSYDEKTEVIGTSVTQNTGDIAPNTVKEIHYGIYAGPKIVSALKGIGNDMDKVVDFGMFDVIAKPCLYLMNLIYDNVIKNYGIAIILLTILFKLLLWPLGTKSYKSMNDMKKLQPLVNEIRQKHAGNKQKLNEEMMNLYKTYKVNPLSGCLPLLVQMPIFFAFYKMLYSAIELRHAPFFGWIHDLSAPDRLFSFNFVIPYFDPPTGIPVLTLLMGGSMFLQQKMSPPAGDPAQAKMMMLMPVFMTFIFLNFSSGLVLYWLVNNIVSIIQQYYIMKKYA